MSRTFYRRDEGQGVFSDCHDDQISELLDEPKLIDGLKNVRESLLTS